MKTLVLYYSYTGHTKTLAEKIAAEEAADLVEIRDVKRPDKLKAYTAGCYAAIKGNAWPICPIEADLTAYDRLLLLSPIWAGNPPPAVNAVLPLLPTGKVVSVKLVSASGKSGCRERLETEIRARGGTPENFEDIRA
jgi:Flavodoxins